MSSSGESVKKTNFSWKRLAFRLGLLLVAAALVLRIYWEYKNWGGAAHEFARALEALDAKDFDQVREQLEALEDESRYAAHRHFLQGALLLQEGNPSSALQEFELAVPEEEIRVRALVLSGQAMCQLGQQKNAERLWLEAVAEDSEAVQAYRCLAMLYYDLGAMDHAQKYALRVADLDRQDPRPYRLLGLMRKDSEHYEDAVKYYLESLRRNPQPPAREEILLELAESQIKLGQNEAALATLKDCPRSVNRLVLEAECNFSINRREQAEALLQEGLRQSPDDFSALLLQGTMALERGDPAAAVAALSRSVEVRPKDYQARFQLAQAYRRLGNREQAEKHNQLAEQIKQIRLEFSELHQRAAEQPSDAEVRYRLGHIAQQLDQPDLARLWLQAALALDPQHEPARRELAHLLSK